eukprot:TRINITY_DN3481_c5_g1_i1.p1 TRINITY_DN3481_c5_g1~~TRINITY_DN3481_c5_g1_i1.p1  ORF type:complete len:185 (+),score=23.26 TRINITY_DN3481_c5_g1_i1:44-556(+)
MGVRNRKHTAKGKVMKIVGKSNRCKREHTAKGSMKNPVFTSLIDGKEPLAKAYGRLGIDCNSSLRKDKKVKALSTLANSEIGSRSLPAIRPEGPQKPKHVSELEYAYVQTLVEKHGLNFVDMSKDLKVNEFQQTPRQLQKRVLKCIKLERQLFPEQFKGLEMDTGIIDAE